MPASGSVSELTAAGSVPGGAGLARDFAAGDAAASLGATTATQVVSIAGPGGQRGPATAAGRHDQGTLAGSSGPARPGGTDSASPASASTASASTASASTGPASGGPASAPVVSAAAAVAGGQVAAPGSDSVRDVIPDLMATPVFAELRMPGLGDTAARAGQDPANGVIGRGGRQAMPGTTAASPARAGSVSPATSWPGSWLTTARGFGDLIKSRRGLVLTAPLTATAIVAGIVFLAFPGFGDQLLKGLTLHPGATGSMTRSVTSGKQGGAAPGSARRPGTGSGQHGAPAPGRSGSGNGSPGSPSSGSSPAPGQSGHPSPSGQPSPSGRPSGSPAPSPTSSSPAATGSRLPLGYAWQSVTASSIGTTAGWRLGAPATWVLTPGVQSYLRPAAGAARLGVDLAPFAGQAPVREARYLQAAAIAQGTYRRYQLVSILPRRLHGWPAATWTFRWKPAGKPVIDVTEVLFTATTSAGPQPFDISMAAPAANASYASHVLGVALRTFSPLP